MYRFLFICAVSLVITPFVARADLSSLGEQAADSTKVLGWKILGDFEQGKPELAAELLVVPATYSTNCLIQLSRLIADSSEEGTHTKEMIAATLVFIPAREPIWAQSLSVTIPFSLRFPEDIPDGRYQMEVLPVGELTLDGVTTYDLQRGTIPKTRAEENLVVISGPTVRDWKVVLPDTLLEAKTGADSEAPILEAWLFDADNVLRATASYPIARSNEMAIRLPDDERWNSVANGVLQFHVGCSTAKASISFEADNFQVTSLKPLASGVYRESNGVFHYWYADDEHALYWDGRPWVPFGGMFYVFKMKPIQRERDIASEEFNSQLDILQDAGFRDLYVNMGVGQTSPDWYLQNVVDEFNRRGIRFGWQLTIGAKPFTAWEIYSSSSQGLISATSKQRGVLTVALPEVPITELMVIPADGAGSAQLVSYTSAVSHVKAGLEIAQILEAQDGADRHEVELQVPGLAPGNYYVLTNVIQQGKRISNVWERLDEIKTGLNWISRIEWGEGLRFFVDPVCNESGFNQRYETVRVSSDAFNADFSAWLRDRYSNDLNALSEAWAIAPGAVKDFDQAARLLPVRDLDANNSAWVNSITLVDPQTGALIPTKNSPGSSWMDYLQAVRVSYAQKLDEVARYLKSMVNVPIIIKRVSPWVSLESVVQVPGGIDGIGIEPYPESGSSIPYCNLSGRAEADLSAQTTWLLATEIGYSSKPGNKDVRSWPDIETMERVVREALYVGAQGVFLFGWRLPGREWVNHALLNQPDRLQWARDVADSIEDSPSAVWSQYGIVFPEGQSWWWRSNGKLWTRYNSVYTNPPSAFAQSVRLSGEGVDALWAVSSSVPIPSADPVVVNLSDAFFADYYAEDIDDYIDSGKHVVYLGHWPDGAEQPSRLAKHFVAGKQVKHPDGRGKIQPLKVFEGDEVLAEDANGNVWAKINLQDRILIVSVTPAVPPFKNSAQLPAYLNPEWISQLLADASAHSKH